MVHLSIPSPDPASHRAQVSLHLARVEDLLRDVTTGFAKFIEQPETARTLEELLSYIERQEASDDPEDSLCPNFISLLTVIEESKHRAAHKGQSMESATIAQELYTQINASKLSEIALRPIGDNRRWIKRQRDTLEGTARLGHRPDDGSWVVREKDPIEGPVVSFVELWRRLGLPAS